MMSIQMDDGADHIEGCFSSNEVAVPHLHDVLAVVADPYERALHRPQVLDAELPYVPII
jgi:hypothetical protein